MIRPGVFRAAARRRASRSRSSGGSSSRERHEHDRLQRRTARRTTQFDVDMQTHFLPDPLTARVAYMGRSLIASSCGLHAAMRGGAADPRGPAARRAHAGRARRAHRPRTLGDRPLGAGRRLAQRRQPPRGRRACGFDLPLVLVPRDTSQHETLDETALLSPERRLERFFAKARQRRMPAVAEPRPRFDPLGLLAGPRPPPRHLHRHRRLRPRHPGSRRDHPRTRHRPLHARGEPPPPRRTHSTNSAPAAPTEEARASPGATASPEPVLELDDRARRTQGRPRAGGHARLRRPQTRRHARAPRQRASAPRSPRSATSPACSPRRPRRRHAPSSWRLRRLAELERRPRTRAVEHGRDATTRDDARPPHPTGRRDVAGERSDVRAAAARRALDDLAVAEPERDVARRRPRRGRRR